MIFVECRRK